MAFEVISAASRSTGRSGSKEPAVSFYGRSSQFRINTPAVTALGNPTKLEVLYDKETNRIAFVPSDAAYAVTLRQDADNTNGSKYFGFRALADAANLADDLRFTAPLVQDEESGYWLVDLNTIVAAPPSRAGRKKATAAETTETTETVDEPATEAPAVEENTAETASTSGRRNR
jgi:hypothetical protein